MPPFPFAFWKSGVAVFDPATLSLSGWWRGSYGGAPWAGNASAGVSATTGDLVVGAAPDVGTAQNGYTPADFIPANVDYLTNATDATTLYSTTASSVVALIWIDAADAATGNIYDDTAIIIDGNADYGLTVKANGADVDIVGMAYSSGYVTKTVTVTTGAYHLVMMTHDGTDLGMTVDSVARSTIACGTLNSLTGTVQVGYGYGGTHLLDGRILELMTAAVTLSASDYANVKSYVNSRYSLAL